jgi:hypothetical protein
VNSIAAVASDHSKSAQGLAASASMADSSKQLFNNVVLSTRGGAVGQLVVSSAGLAWRPSDASSSKESDDAASKTIKIEAGVLAKLALTKNSPSYGLLHVTTTNGKYDRFDGLSRGAMEKLPKLCEEWFEKTLEKDPMNTAGLNLGTLRIDDKRRTLFLQYDKRRSMEFPLNKVTQCVVPNKNELELQVRGVLLVVLSKGDKQHDVVVDVPRNPLQRCFTHSPPLLVRYYVCYY